jgi:hypothetical protein
MLFLLFCLLFLVVPVPAPVPRWSPHIIINKLMRTKYFRNNAVPPVLYHFLADPVPAPVPCCSPYTGTITNKLMRTIYFRKNAVPPVLSTLPGCSCSCACAALFSLYYHQQAGRVELSHL